MLIQSVRFLGYLYFFNQLTCERATILLKRVLILETLRGNLQQRIRSLQMCLQRIVLPRIELHSIPTQIIQE